MKKSIAIQMDNIEKIDYEFDTSFLIGYEAQERDYDIYRTQVNVPNNMGTLNNGDANNILKDGNIWTPTNTGGNSIDLLFNLISRGKSYEADQNNLASYISFEFKLNPNFRSIIGLRGEKYFTHYTGQDSSGDREFKGEKVTDTFDLFPSSNFIFSVTENSNIRFSYSKTTARPSFKEASIAQIFDPLSNITYIGNIDLKPTYIDNLDLRFENFGENNQMFAVSAFYKNFKKQIQRP